MPLYNPSTFTATSSTTIQNKTLDNTNTANLKDTLLILEDDGDTTKKAALQLSGVTAGQTRVLTVPDKNITLAGIADITDAGLAVTDVTTNDVSTTAHGFAPKAPNNTTTFLRGDATWAAPVTTSTPTVKYATLYENTTRISGGANTAGTGAVTYGAFGVQLATGNTGNSLAEIEWTTGAAGAGMQVFDGNPIFTTTICVTGVGGDNGVQGIICVGRPTTSQGAGGVTFTDRHFGWKLVRAAGATALYATQADGTTENASAALIASISANDVIELIAVATSNSACSYYYRLNGGALSAATTLTGNFPAADFTMNFIKNCATNASVTNGALTFQISNACYER